MFVYIGLAVVFGSVMVGFLMAGGKPLVLFQPNEYVVIAGAALGALLAGTPTGVLRALLGQLARVARSARTRQDYQELLVMGFEVLSLARQEGPIALESHAQDPDKSPLFEKYARFRSDRHAVTFFTDTVGILVGAGSISEHDFSDLLDADIDVQFAEASKPAGVLRVTGDALPGLGIVAAVLGIVITMGHIDGPPAEIGHHVGAALVGTFLGVLLAYGFVAPLAQALASKAEGDRDYLLALKGILISLHQGRNPTLAVELGRRGLPHELRPDSAELTAACRAARSPKP